MRAARPALALSGPPENPLTLDCDTAATALVFTEILPGLGQARIQIDVPVGEMI